MDKTQKEIRFLKIYSVVLTLALVAVTYLTLQPKDSNFEEINAERINILEPNGDLKLVISNSEKQHPGIMNGKEIPHRERAAGLIFFNGVGDECGGLIYDGNEEEAMLVLSVDKFRDDQVMQLQYAEDTKTDMRRYGLQIWDYQKEDTFNERMKRAEEFQKLTDIQKRTAIYMEMKKDSLLSEDRMFVGKRMNKDVGIFINDSHGKPRIRIYIDKDNNPKFEMLNEQGELMD